MKPFIKWPGGKSGEIGRFEYLIPEYDRYIEPFAGGGALYFHLNPEKALLNDTSEDLMRLYELVKEQDAELHRILNLYCRSFGTLREICSRKQKQLIDLFRLYEFADTQGMDLKELKIHHVLTRTIAVSGLRQIAGDLIPDWDEYAQVMLSGVQEKLSRTLANHRKKTFSAKDLAANMTTAFTGSFYIYFRNVFNAIRAGKMICSDAYRVANFYFIREYCYGSMFRYNAAGEFNIPYGGNSYNKKDLSVKVEQMFGASVTSLLKRTQLFCMDFEEFLRSQGLTGRDFLFLDPPYDTEFTEYEQHSFGQEDHRRLAEYLYETKARFLLVIKNTEYIYSLYHEHFRILTFDNSYTYNVRSRNERKTQHLIVTNIPEGEVPWLRENVSD